MQKIRKSNRSEVLSIDVPHKTDTYSPISNHIIIEEVLKICNLFGYTLVNEEYETASKGQQVKMKFYLQPQDEENGFQISILNSYNKTIAARMCGGVYSHICWNLNYIGEITQYRKHTGNAVEDVQDFIIKAFDQQENKFKNAKIMQENMLLVPLTKTEQAELAGRMLIDNEIISPSQMSVLHTQMKSTDFKYNFDMNTLWGLYNHTTHSIKSEHPMTFLQTQQAVQSFFIDTYEEMTENKLILV